ncbi:gliding motility-associated C-terminal domain-containing protein [Myroides sp. JBRI-B21084]|uniref:T9SS type B sorting domain-containing protein n=1 Tax=Myroides sp. JBRI-B21084 TaxID=3119977 RepID=UPI0026E2479F|nr:gliding motility-associated C-terminal domain-containing protein [Paenimyroides cloacae]WKW45937.1 gliding motility-associated C-terminal domain-containing protein [Paenimyroides cloacae]
MFRKILFFLLLTNLSVNAQKIGPDYDCFDINITDIDVDTRFVRDAGDPDMYIVCKDKRIGVTPNFQTQYLRKTNIYEVEPIAYNPYPLDPAINGGTEANNNVSFHDERTPCPIDLPFKFCFFDQTFERIFIWGNGAVSFTQNTQCSNSDYVSALGAVFTGPIPGNVTNNNFLNSIFGSFQHTHWDRSRYNHGSINYQVYGTAPCRTFVISFYQMPASGVNAQFCPPPTPLQGHQIVLHELTNVIDVNIVRHDNCPANNPGESLGIIGIINANGTQGYAPPNRNLGNWDAIEESWRFAPAGVCMYRTQWNVTDTKGTVSELDNCEGELSVVIDELKDISATLIVETCDEPYMETYKIKVRPAIEINTLDLQRIVCDKDQNTYDLTSLTADIKAAQSASQAEINKLRFYYYKTEDDALNKVNDIKTLRDYPINMGENKLYIRIEYADLTECYEILEANILKVPVEVTPKESVFICDEYKLPVLTNDEFYLKMERLDENASFVVKTIPNIAEGQVINEAGYYLVYVKKTNEYGCEDVKSYLLMVQSCSYPKGISPNGDGNNDYLDLTYNNVVELKIYNRYGNMVYKHGIGYKRQWHGQDNNDKVLPSGTYFMHVITPQGVYQDWIQLMYEVK